ncbi:4-hydroxy-4-methyl-2-oxoglutarate aldolase [Tolypocladium ophioglossoides CBS 100239]|uniref:4-hydroxy-4-methyl-2-oxoglutarate aldolase n=1 Tax=Tolypocladium ophioglossoides (strain CBS 100239) TaxID=1163406 RepID=A0A0L0N268_TOLOC|nr:4-hydroxy-4-methyl-2-oxoglutarate aldolase [Tolypocladium ophioglossoides CBS 100239]
MVELRCHAHGGFLEGLVMYSPEFQAGKAKIVGPAFTVKFAPKADKTAPKLQGNYIDQIPEGAVLFISQPVPHINACYGGLMSLRAKMLNAKGTVIDGAVRDLQEHRDLDYPLFARSTGTTAGGAVCFPSEVNVPLKLQSSIQNAVVSPGDYIIADLDGVVCLPAGLAEKVLDVVPGIFAADNQCAKAIREGMTVKEAFATYRGR